MSSIDLVCLDADDTLWHNEVYFRAAEEQLARILEPWAGTERVSDTLLDVERENIPRYGFGAKAFVLSMIETAIALSAHQIDATQVAAIIDLGKAILDQPVEFLDDVVEVVEQISALAPLVLVTKGDLVHQEAKVMESGLAPHFRSIEIVAHKDVETYARVFARHGVDPTRVVMVGNSVKSDILPVLALGGWALYVPHEHGWALEHDDFPDHPRARELERFSEVGAILAELTSTAP